MYELLSRIVYLMSFFSVYDQIEFSTLECNEYRPRNDQAIMITDSLFCEGRTKVNRSKPRKRLVPSNSLPCSHHRGSTDNPSRSCTSNVRTVTSRYTVAGHITFSRDCLYCSSVVISRRKHSALPLAYWFSPAVSLPSPPETWRTVSVTTASFFIGYSRLAINRVSGSTALAVVR